MGTIRAVVVTPDAPGRLALGQIAAPTATPSEALVRVAAVSLNRGEVRRAQSAATGALIGWDLAGVVEHAAADGSGPPAGAQVVGTLPTGAWAELVAVPTHALARLPETVSLTEAATLPIAGLTALHAVAQGGSLIGRSVLVTGASGGVGLFAVQLAQVAGARVVGHVRSVARVAAVREAGVATVVVGADVRAAVEHGPYHLVIDGVGGETLSQALTLLAPEGTAVSYGRTVGPGVELDLGAFFSTGGLRLYGLWIFHELRREPAGVGLARLIPLVEAGRLRPHIALETGWADVGEVAQRLLARDFPGKAVLLID
jgi:NADPH:quinone reductase-like Zn-dependent oxidoreductase